MAEPPWHRFPYGTVGVFEYKPFASFLPGISAAVIVSAMQRRCCIVWLMGLGILLAGIVNCWGEPPKAISPTLSFAQWTADLKEPTSMAWITLPNAHGEPENVLLVLEKWTGNVRGFLLQPDGAAAALKAPLIKLAVNFKSERGLLGIAVHPQFAQNRFVYLFYTQSDRDGPDGRSDLTRGQTITRFTLTAGLSPGAASDSLRLENPHQILTFPYQPHDSNGPNSCGGKILFGPDGKLYGVYGDQNRHGLETNEPGGRVAAGIIFRINDDGSVPADNPWADHNDPWVRKYFAIGIRNSFGLAFDPQTHLLWETDNGDALWDELNIVPAKFNGGSNYIMGPLSDPANAGRHRAEVPADRTLGSVYGDPVFSWYRCRGLTCLAFLHTDRYGPADKDTLLVGEVNASWLMQFHLTPGRDRVAVKSPSLDARVVMGDSPDQIAANQKEIMFATGAGTITDMQLGPDGLLYLCSYRDGAIYILKPAP